MIGKIAVEEHFVSQDAKAYLPALGVTPDVQKRIDGGLVDVEQLRLPEMGRHGIAMQFVSLTADGVQMEPNRDKAVKIAKSANDELHNQFGKSRHGARQYATGIFVVPLTPRHIRVALPASEVARHQRGRHRFVFGHPA